MAALVTPRSRHFLSASKCLDNKTKECKYYDSKDDTKKKVLTALAQTDAKIFTIIVDKYNFESPFYDTYGNKLYEKVFIELLKKIVSQPSCGSLNILLDRTTSLSNDKLAEIVKSMDSDIIKNAKKYDSISNKCIQLADFAVGAIREKYENKDDGFYKIIEKRIHCP